MAITFTFDNDSLTDGDQQLTLDETAGLQTVDDTGSADGDFVDPDDDVELTYVAGVLGGSLDADFLNYLNALTLFDDKDAAFTFAAGAEGASSTSSFITATPTAGEEISDLFFSINPAVPSGLISGMTTLDGAALYFHIDPSNNDRAIVTTSETAGEGRIVAAFYLDEDDTDHLTAQVQMVTFEAIKHPDGTNPDDAVAFTDVLQISAAGTTSFDFDELPSGSFLWVAIGSSNAGLLVTGDDLNVNTDSGSNKYGQFITGGSDPSDTMNTSQGGAGATIGVNSQHFVRGAKVNGVYQDGSIADFTLVSQLDTLANSSSATGTNIQDIDYGGYIQTVGASLFISQLTGTHADMRVQLFNADADGNAGNGYQVEEGFGYLGDNTTDAELHDDLAVAVGSVTVHHNGVDYVFLASGADTQTQGDITVTFETYGGVENSFTVTGADALDTIDWTAASGATFNRFKVQALGSTDAFDVGRIDIAQGVTESAGLGSHLFVDDDGPTLAAANASARVEEDELATGITDNDLFTATATLTNADLQAIVNTGADEPVSFDLNLAVSGAVLDVDGNAMTSKGVAMTWSESGGVVSAVAGARTVFTITQTAGAATTSDPTDDVFTVVLLDQLDHPAASGDSGIETINLTPAFSAADYDLDALTLTGPKIQLVVENDVPTLAAANASARVEEDELATGITDNDLFTATATLTNADLQAIVNTGADEPVSFDLNLAVSGAVLDVDGNAMTSKGVAMTWSESGGVVSAVAGARTVFTITQTAGAATTSDPTDDVFTVVLLDQLDHPAASGDSGIETINLTPAFSAADYDLDALTLTGPKIQLVVENDVPTLAAANASARVEEDELATGITDNDLFTATATLTNADLQAIVNTGADEPVSFDLNLAVSGAVLDVDGNAMTSKGVAMTWSESGGVVSAVAGARTVFTITQTAGAATTSDPTDDVFTVVLLDQLDHPNASGDSGIETINLTPAFSAADYDLDALTLTGPKIQLVVENDVPTLAAANASARVEEDELATGITDNDLFTATATLTNADLQAIVNTGADEPVSFDLNLAVSGAVLDVDGNAMTSKGVAMTWSESGGVVSAVAGARTVFTITQTAGAATTSDPTDDVFTVVLLDQLDHPAASGDSGIETINLTPAFSAADYDLDALTLTGPKIQLVVENDVPTLAAANASARVEEDELATGITDNDLFTATATLTNADLQAIVNTGADEPVSFDLNLAVSGAVLDVDGNAMTSKGVAMTWSESGGVVSAVAGARTVFTITQTAGAATTSDPTDDVFTVVLLDQLDHPNASGDSGIETINLTPAFSAADYDLDALTLTGPKIQLVVENDVPAITSQILNSVVDASGPVSSATKSLNGAIGADENNATNITSAGVKTYTFDNYTTPTNVWPTLTAVLSATGDTINYYESSAVGADLVYSIVLDQANAGQYTFTVHKAAPTEKLEFDFSDLPSGQNLFGVLADREAGVLQVDGPGLLVVGRDAVLAANGSYTNASDTINTSKGGGGVTIGIDNQMFDPGDGAVFVFLDNADDKSIGGAGLTQTSADDADTLGFEDLLPVQGAELEVVQKQGGAPCGMKITAYYVTPHDTAADGAKIVSANDPEAKAPPTTDDVSADARSFIDNPLDGGTIVSITTVNVYDRANPSNILTSATIDQDTGVVTYVDGDADGVIDHASGVDVTASETSAGSDIWTVTVTGFDGNDTIAYETAADHNAVLTEGTGGKWDLGGFNLTQGQDTPDQKFDFSVLVNDYDGDSYGAQSEVTIFDDFSIGIDGTGQFDDGMVAGVLI